jgi:hypothetical protein
MWQDLIKSIMKEIKKECLILTLLQEIAEMIFDVENHKNGDSFGMYNI